MGATYQALAIAVLEVAGLLALLLGAHRFRRRTGPAPFLMLLGALQFAIYGLTYTGARVPLVGLPPLDIASTVCFPAILSAVLVIYASDGTSPARVAMLQLIGLALLFPVIQTAVGLQIPEPPPGVADALARPLYRTSLRLQLGSCVAWGIDFLAIVVVYQSLANAAPRVPHALRAIATLAVALALDSVVFNTIAFAGEPGFGGRIGTQLAVRPLVALLAGPPIALYLDRAPRAPEVARGAFDILSLRVGTLEESLRRSEEARRVFHRFFEVASDGKLLLDGETRVLDANAAAARIAGVSTASLLRSRFTEILRDWSAGGADEGTPADGADISGLVREVQLRRDGRVATVLVRVTPLEPGIARTPRYLVLLIDDTERRALETALIHAQKMNALGTLAGGLAHDFNNLLLAILGPASVLERRLPEGSHDAKLAKLIATSAGRARELTRTLLTLSHRAPLAVKPVDVNAVVRETVELLTRSIEKRIEIRVDLAPLLDEIDADPTQVQQGLLNVCLNARDAIAGAGTIEVSTAAVDVDRALAARTPGLAVGRFVEIRVSDTGSGMTKEVAARIFEPFYTTKAAGVGTGLGLAMTYGIVRNHRGAIAVASEPGRGTSFRLFFPARAAGRAGAVEPAATAAVAAASSSAPPARGRETVLVIDDEPMILELATSMLEDLGYRVVTAASSAAALAIFRERAAEFCLVVLDLDLPEMPGAELAAVLRRLEPRVRILVTSGYGASYARELQTFPDLKFLEKPYRYEELARMVRAMLDGGGAKTGGSGRWPRAEEARGAVS